jgi:hypothetical protein
VLISPTAFMRFASITVISCLVCIAASLAILADTLPGICSGLYSLVPGYSGRRQPLA